MRLHGTPAGGPTCSGVPEGHTIHRLARDLAADLVGSPVHAGDRGIDLGSRRDHVRADRVRLLSHHSSDPGYDRSDAQRLLDDRVEVGLVAVGERLLQPLEHTRGDRLSIIGCLLGSRRLPAPELG